MLISLCIIQIAIKVYFIDIDIFIHIINSTKHDFNEFLLYNKETVTEWLNNVGLLGSDGQNSSGGSNNPGSQNDLGISNNSRDTDEINNVPDITDCNCCHDKNRQLVGDCPCEEACDDEILEPHLNPGTSECCVCYNKPDFTCKDCNCNYCKNCVDYTNNSVPLD